MMRILHVASVATVIAASPASSGGFSWDAGSVAGDGRDFWMRASMRASVYVQLTSEVYHTRQS